MLKRLIFFVSINLIKLILSNEYCHICTTHTMCRYQENDIPENCTDYQKIELSSDNKSDIVEIHNNLRNFVASGGYINETDTHFPEAAAMNFLRWSDELAEISQRWADQCLLDENQDECRDIEEFRVGQTVIMIEISEKTNIPNFPEIFMTKWSNSFHHFNLKDIIEYKETKTKEMLQYSQLILDKTEYIGCALITFKSPQGDELSTAHIVRMVCNYGPSGYTKKEPIYKIGLPCSLCVSKKCDERFTSLCIVNLRTQLSLETNKINEDVRKIMMEKYNMFQNGDQCFCEINDSDIAGKLNCNTFCLSIIFIISLYFNLFKLM